MERKAIHLFIFSGRFIEWLINIFFLLIHIVSQVISVAAESEYIV